MATGERVTKDSFRAELQRLVRNFAANEDQLTSPGYTETQARTQLITPFFRALGWDIENRGGRREGVERPSKVHDRERRRPRHPPAPTNLPPVRGRDGLQHPRGGAAGKAEGPGPFNFAIVTAKSSPDPYKKIRNPLAMLRKLSVTGEAGHGSRR